MRGTGRAWGASTTATTNTSAGWGRRCRMRYGVPRNTRNRNGCTTSDELLVAARRQVVDNRGEAVTAVPPQHTAQFPQRVLKAVEERLERLGGAQRHRLPVRIGEHEVVHHVIERPAGDGHVERVHPRDSDAARSPTAWTWRNRIVRPSPSFGSGWRCPHARVGEPTRMTERGRLRFLSSRSWR